MSSIFRLWRLSRRGIAATGPTPISSGSTPAATKPRKIPSGLRPFLVAILSLMMTQAEAPSESWLALAALAFERIFILLLAADLVAFGHDLRRLQHRHVHFRLHRHQLVVDGVEAVH